MLLFWSGIHFTVQGQVSDTLNRPAPRLQQADSMAISELRSGLFADSLQNADTVIADTVDITSQPQGDIETTINYTARDSIRLNVLEQKVYLYGDASIDYGQITLTADFIQIDYAKNTLAATYSLDTADRKVGIPLFQDGGETYEARRILYNFKTRKAVITGLVTQQGDAYMIGTKVVKNAKDELFIPQAKYTTCNLEHPHYHIEASKLKVIPNKKVVSGPFHLEFNDIPIPLGFAFGMFPDQKKSKSGIIFPTYGEERRRGFFLRDGGYFFDINEYIKVAVTGEIYSKGSRGIRVGSNYRKRYRYSGNLNFSYNRLTSGEEGDSSFTNDFWVNWSHSPQSRGNSRFSASVNAGTSTYNANNQPDVFLNSRANFNSTVNYSTSFPGTPLSLSTSFRLNQDVISKEVDILFPEVSLNMSRLFPFKRVSRGKIEPLNNIGVSYTMNLSNELTNRLPNVQNSEGQDSIAAFTLDNLPLFFENARNGIQHQIPISTNFKLLNYFTVSPSFNYQGLMYFKKLDYSYNDLTNEVETDTLQTFSLASSWNVSMSMNTRFYGMFKFKNKRVEAIRHVVTPSVSFNYRPDFSNPERGYYQDVQVDSLGNTRRRSVYEGFRFGSPPAGQVAGMAFSLTNNFEMKVKTKDDTVNTTKKVPLLENLSFNTSYNFVADSFKLAPFRFSGRTRIGAFNINFGGTVDPYSYILQGVNPEDGSVSQFRIDEFAWKNGQGIGRLSQANVAISTNFNPKARNRDAQVDQSIQNEFDRSNLFNTDGELDEQTEADLEFIMANPSQYIDFNIPWSLRINYNFNYRKTGFEKSVITQTLNFSGDLSLTPKWKINFRSGFDFENNDFTQTSFGITRDLHCWVLNFNWIPFGAYESFSLDIRVKSSLLQDLKLSKRSNFRDNF